MGDYNIDINVNMGGSQGNFQTLIDSISQLNANFQKVGDSATTAGNRSKQSFADSMNIINKYGGSVQAAAANIDKWKAKIEELNRLNNTGAISQTKYNSQINAAAAAIKRIETATRQYNSVLGQTATHTRSATLGINTLTTAFNKLGAVMGVSFGLYGVFRVLQSIVKTIAEFDLAQKKLQSILGETAQGMKELTQSAIDLGKSSIFGAKGISELQIELAKMGFTKNEIMAMQVAINDLAIATQEDLASSAEVVANIIKTYQLTATETRDVVNVMGKAFNDSALGLSNFREAIKYVAPVAKQAGLSFRETVAALELLSNAGLKGSLAGTGLNNVLKAMMDSNSKLAKELGGTVSGWEGFTSVMQRAREEGWNMQDVFGLITQRATGAFSTFMEGLPTLEEMQKKLEDVSNVMRDQMLVQLDSIAYQAKVTKGVWESLVLSIDSGSGTISKSIKLTLEGLQKWMMLIGGLEGKVSNQLVNKLIQLKETLALEGLDETLTGNLKEYEYLVNRMANESSKASANWIANNLQEINRLISRSDELISSAIVKGAKKRIEALKIEGKTYKDFEASRNSAILALGFEMDDLDKKGKRNTIQFKVIQEALEQIEKLRFVNDNNESARIEANTKAIKDRYASEIEMLKLLQKIEALRIKNATDGYLELMLLADSKFKFETAIANKELERDIALGQNKEKVKEFNVLRLQEIELEHANTIQDINLKMNKEINKDTEKALTEREKIVKDIVEQTVDDIIKEYQRLTELNKFMDKFGQDNPIINMLFGKGLRSDLLSGAISKDDVSNFAETFGELSSIVGDNLEGIVDSWVDATDKIVDQLNRQVDETQSAIAVEAELMAAGYANNLTAERNKLENLKEMRREALEDQKQAQKVQLAMDSAQQVSGLITSAVKVFQAESGKGILGIALAIAGIATMFGMMAKYRALAKQQSIEQFAEGGWIGGKSHRDGGTHIEAEKGEYVINKRSAFKHKELIEAINGDNKYELNKIYLNNLKNQVLTASVSLDDSKYLKGIYEKLNEKGKAVEYINGYRIERVGNVTTKIRLN